MLKLGVFEREEFLQETRGGLFFMASKSRVSYQLLRNSDSNFFEALMPYIQLSGGTYRTTYRGRFRNLDPEVNELLADTFDRDAAIEIHDWAASACLTSAEWAQSLLPLFPNSNFVASDILLFLVEVEDEQRTAFVFEPSGAPLQYVNRPFVVRMSPPESWKLPVNAWMWRRAWRRWQALNPLPDAVQDWIASKSYDALVYDGLRFEKLSLVHPEAAQFASRETRFSTRQHSAFEALDSPVHVIRTMNIFNRAYFGDEQLKTGVDAVVRSLVTGGIWIVGRTLRENPPIHDVTVFRKRNDRSVTVLKRIGAGSEIESLVL